MNRILCRFKAGKKHESAVERAGLHPECLAEGKEV